MKCDDVQAEVTARRIARGGGADGAGETAAADEAAEPLAPEMEEHLAACAECRAEVDGLGGLWNRMALLEAEPPRAELRERFDAVLSAYRAGLEAAEGPGEGAVQPGRPDPGGSPSREGGEQSPWWRRLLDSIPTGRPGFHLAYGLLALVLGVGLGSLVPGTGPGTGGAGADAGGTGDLDQLRTEVRALHELVALSLLDAPSATERLKGVAFGSRMDRPDREVLDALLQAATRDPNVNVRLAAIEALAPVASEPRVLDPLARALPDQESPSVQVALVDVLLASDGETARQAAVSLLERETVHPEVRRHVQERLGRSV